VLTELRVRDLAVIADVRLTLGTGLNVLTGETGAGKSMLVDALALLLGERASGDRVRPGADRAVIEAVFEPSGATRAVLEGAAREAGVDLDDGRLVVRRELRTQGPNRAWANGSPTTVAVLARLGRLLVDLHGQHEAQSLLTPATQRDLLDAFADAGALRAAVAEAHAAADRLRADMAALVERRDDITRRADYLRHVAREIADAAPQAGEDETLTQEARRLGHVEDLQRLTAELADVLDAEGQGAVGRLGHADRVLDQLARYDDSVARWRDLLETAAAATDELARAVRDYAANLDADPGRLAEIEARRDVLYRLQHKYGPAIADVLETRVTAERELDLLDTATLDLSNLETALAAADARLADAARALTRARGKGATRLAREVGRLLPGLGMPDGRFTVLLTPREAVAAHGADTVAFLVQLNVGLEARPLAQVASGGELSRLMLALKVVLAEHDAVPSLVFDEVDQGVGGEVGAQVADALARVAGRRQVLVITHLAPIAGRADRHLRIAKRTAGGMTTADVQPLDAAEREIEVARMLGDAADVRLREHAGALLKRR
jgi:DNA repair protein RecN (Recombination protein N)